MAQSNTKEKAAAIVAVTVLLAVVIWLILLASSVYRENGSVGDRPRLFWWWSILKWWIGDTKTIADIFAGFCFIVATGAQCLAKLHSRLCTLLFILFLCLTGIAAATLFLSIGTDLNQDIVKQFVNVVEKPGEDIAGRITLVIGGTIAWLSSFMAIQLGLSLKKTDGVLISPSD